MIRVPMRLVAEYRDARREEEVARLRRTLALRAMVATGMSQRQIAEVLGVSQPAVSQQLKSGVSWTACTLRSSCTRQAPS